MQVNGGIEEFIVSNKIKIVDLGLSHTYSSLSPVKRKKMNSCECKNGVRDRNNDRTPTNDKYQNTNHNKIKKLLNLKKTNIN